MISIKKILIITGTESYPIIRKVVDPIQKYSIVINKAPITISAFLSKTLVIDILKQIDLSNFDLVLLPGFVQWDSTDIESEFSIDIKKGPEFASDLPQILKHIDTITLSNTIPANKLLKVTGEEEYHQIVEERVRKARKKIGSSTFYLNKKKSDLIIGNGLPPPIIAEIVNCPEKDDESILKKAKHYIDSGAEIIDIGCIANKPQPERVKQVIKLLNNNFNTLISIDSMNPNEIRAAVDEGIDMILSLDLGNYKGLTSLPKDIPIVILPTNLKEAHFPKEPEKRVQNLIQLTKELQKEGFEKLIADPLLETPIAPGLCNSLEAYFLYKQTVSTNDFGYLKLPMFFGISNVVELIDVDSVGINGLLASIAIELDVGILFTVEHSTKLIGGVSELTESVKLNYVANYKKTPPINQGIYVFKAKGKVSQEIPKIDKNKALFLSNTNESFVQDENGYFRIYTDLHSRNIQVLFYSNEQELLNLFVGKNAETLSKKIIELELTTDVKHLVYLGRELKKAEIYTTLGKPYIQDNLK